MAQGCFTDATGGAKALFWRNSCVGYNLHAGASRRVSLDQATAVAAAAFEAWRSSTCAQGGTPSIQAIDLGPVECAKVQYNLADGNQNVIFFHDDAWPYGASDSTLGLTTVTFDTKTGEILGADIEMNATQNLVVGDPAPPGSYNLATVITHEVGHFLGLAHSTASNAVMFAKYSPVPRLLSDDMEGLCSIYPSDGSRVSTDGVVKGASCDPAPHGGLISACTSPPGTGGTEQPDTSKSSGGCSLGPRSASSGGIAAMSAALGLMFFLRRRRAAGMWHGIAALTVPIFASLFFAGKAGGSVSIALQMDELAQASTAAAIVNPVQRRSVWEGGRIYSYTRVRIEERVAGDVAQEIWIRTMGGIVGTTGQLVEGEAMLEIGVPALLFLRPLDAATAATFEVTGRAQGHFRVVLDENQSRRVVASRSVGALVAPSTRAAERANRFAVEALHGRPIEEATREIVRLWSSVKHP